MSTLMEVLGLWVAKDRIDWGDPSKKKGLDRSVWANQEL